MVKLLNQYYAHKQQTTVSLEYSVVQAAAKFTTFVMIPETIRRDNNAPRSDAAVDDKVCLKLQSVKGQRAAYLVASGAQLLKEDHGQGKGCIIHIWICIPMQTMALSCPEGRVCRIDQVQN